MYQFYFGLFELLLFILLCSCIRGVDKWAHGKEWLTSSLNYNQYDENTIGFLMIDLVRFCRIMKWVMPITDKSYQWPSIFPLVRTDEQCSAAPRMLKLLSCISNINIETLFWDGLFKVQPDLKQSFTNPNCKNSSLSTFF